MGHRRSGLSAGEPGACVASWRQSPGHWDAVKAQQASYGYDIREGSNGIWYATGIFRPKQ